jgi:hypothetical protein
MLSLKCCCLFSRQFIVFRMLSSNRIHKIGPLLLYLSESRLVLEVHLVERVVQIMPFPAIDQQNIPGCLADELVFY